MFWSHNENGPFYGKKKWVEYGSPKFLLLVSMLLSANFASFFLFFSWTLLFMTCSPLPHCESMMASTLSIQNVYISEYNNDNYLPPGWCVGSWCFSNWNGRGLFFLSVRYLGFLGLKLLYIFLELPVFLYDCSLLSV